ncbi:MAG: hypothetical protein ACOYJZ_07800 [Acutalibacter sp.]|jgi:hypothetical protein
MGVYIGFLDKQGDEPRIFFNFRPIAQVADSQVKLLSDDELATLLPDSKLGNINLQYSWHHDDERRVMDAMFDQNTLAVFEFLPQDLEDNVNATGKRNLTGYKVSAMDRIRVGKLRGLNSCGVYRALRSGEIRGDFDQDAVVTLNAPGLLVQEKVFVEWNGRWAGPYEVNYRRVDFAYYIKPQIKEHQYTVSSYAKEDVSLLGKTIFDDYGYEFIRWNVLVPKPGAQPLQTDVITDEQLLEALRDSAQGDFAQGNQLRLDDIPGLLKQLENSLLAGGDLQEEIRRQRLQHLERILTAEADVDASLGRVTDYFCDLLVKRQDDPQVEQWLQALLEKHPELMDQLKGSRALTTRREQAEQELEALRQQQEELEEELAARREEADSVNRAAVEEKKAQLLEMDTEYTQLQAKLEAVKKSLGVTGDLTQLAAKQREFREDVAYLEAHKEHLRRDTGAMELEFQQMLSRFHEKMVGLTFDGFLSSKLLRAAAQWEAEQETALQGDLVERVNGVAAADLAPQELVDYLCATVGALRPSYSPNDIVNIAICLTQGFLTVFSGEPGCGKTSICNIFGEVLGLNKLAQLVDWGRESPHRVKRYIPVSVERGWTTKRDFIGYYNPLSKSFDKSNRQVYDALRQLDAEKRRGLAKLPCLILLDEANLSPMEFYWSDFMNICDDQGEQSYVNLGEDYLFGIPETLHFMATINNDHTTETLSPRLVDRAWIITLPRYSGALGLERLPEERIQVISWQSLVGAFLPGEGSSAFSAEIQRIYDGLLAKLREQRFLVSPRIDRAIKRYWAVASQRFVPDETTPDPEVLALDYAVAQRLLPKIQGSGEAFEKWLGELRNLCSSHGLDLSASLLQDMVERGNRQMKYYQFFS